MKTHKHIARTGTSKIQLVLLGVLCMVSAFAVGSKTSGTVRTIGATEALDGRLAGDINGDDMVDTTDVTLILEVASHYRTATAKELIGDPNADGQLTVDDALRILRDLNTTPLN